MTPEEKRERQLKRALPGLAIAVVYFAFGSHWVKQGVEKAQADVKAIYSRGIMPDAMPALTQQQQQLDAEIQKLNQQKAEFGKELNEHAGFLSDSDYPSRLSDRVSLLLTKHHLRESGSESSTDGKLATRAILDIAQRMGKSGDKKPQLNIWQIKFTGAYPDVYRMLKELQQGEPSAIPVSLDMKPAEEDRMGMAWSIAFWTGLKE